VGISAGFCVIAGRPVFNDGNASDDVSGGKAAVDDDERFGRSVFEEDD
jgi:hypothetical protein